MIKGYKLFLEGLKDDYLYNSDIVLDIKDITLELVEIGFKVNINNNLKDEIHLSIISNVSIYFYIEEVKEYLLRLNQYFKQDGWKCYYKFYRSPQVYMPLIIRGDEDLRFSDGSLVDFRCYKLDFKFMR